MEQLLDMKTLFVHYLLLLNVFSFLQKTTGFIIIIEIDNNQGDTKFSDSIWYLLPIFFSNISLFYHRGFQLAE